MRGILVAVVTLSALALLPTALAADGEIEILLRDASGGPTTFLSGATEIVLTNAEDVRDLHVLLVWPDGIGTDRAINAVSTSIDTTEMPNGYYTIRVYGQASSGESRQLLAQRVVLLENARASVGSAAGAIVAGTAVSLVGPLLAATKSMLAGIGGNAAEERGRHHSAHAKVLHAGLLVGGLGSLALAAVGVLFLAAFKVYAEAPTIAGVLTELPIVGTAILVIAAVALAAEAALARAAGGFVRYRVWWTGAIALVVSSVGFHNAFGSPGFIEEGEDRETTRRHQAIRAAGAMGATLALLFAFLTLGHVWRWDFGQHGIDLVLMSAATLVVPIRPLPGAALFTWQPLVWVATTVALLSLYLGWGLALIGPWLLMATSALGALVFAGAFWMLGREEPVTAEHAADADLPAQG